MSNRVHRDSTRTQWDGLKVIVGAKELTIEERCELAEHDAWLVGRFFEELSLPELRTLTTFSCLPYTVRWPIVANDSNFTAEDGLSLATQGIYGFRSASWQTQARGQHRLAAGFPGPSDACDAIFYAWGLTRDHEWVLIQVANRASEPENYEVCHICVRRSNLTQLMGYAKVGPDDIRSALAITIADWKDQKKKQVRRLQETGRMLLTESMANNFRTAG